MRWLWIWVLAGAQIVGWGQAVTGLPSPSSSGINGVSIPALTSGYLYYNSGTNSFVFQTPGASGTVNNCASPFAVAYYAATGTAVSCPAAFTGLGYFSTGAPPATATGTQVVAAIGSTAVANATNLASYPTLCTGGQFSQGLSSGSNNCASPSGSGTVTDGSGVTTAGYIPVSTTTAHVLSYTPTSAYTLSVPTLNANDTVATLGASNSFTGTTNTFNAIEGKYYVGTGTMTLATGSAAGSGASISCTMNHVCDGVSGTATLTTGTSNTTGVLATFTFPSAHTNYANCFFTMIEAGGVNESAYFSYSESASAATLVIPSTPLTDLTIYSIGYWCGGN